MNIHPDDHDRWHDVQRQRQRELEARLEDRGVGQRDPYRDPQPSTTIRIRNEHGTYAAHVEDVDLALSRYLPTGVWPDSPRNLRKRVEAALGHAVSVNLTVIELLVMLASPEGGLPRAVPIDQLPTI